MWIVSGQTLSMAEGDFGVELPVEIEGTELTANDSIKITIKTAKNGSTVIEKDFSAIVDNRFILELTEEESAKLPAGTYAYSLDWYQDGIFMCNIVLASAFKVVDKA